MSTPNDGGPAFPGLETWWNTTTKQHEQVGPPGMSLRDWFAGQAIAVMAAPLKGSTPPNEAIAGWAYGLADAMLAART